MKKITILLLLSFNLALFIHSLPKKETFVRSTNRVLLEKQPSGEVQACRPSALEILDLLKKFENEPLKVKKYTDTRRYDKLGKVFEVGYGFTPACIDTAARYGKPHWGNWKLPTKMTEKQAHVFLTTVVIPAYDKIVDEVVTVPLNDNQRNALLLFTYNLGKTNLERLVRGRGRLNDGNYDSVRKLMPLYVNAKTKNNVEGLKRRRDVEVALFYK